MPALEKHIEEMSSNNLFDGTDFKLASCDDPVDGRVARECGFTSLSVRLVKVLFSPRHHLAQFSLVDLHCVFFLELIGAGYTLFQPAVGNPGDLICRETSIGG
jgi:hypothetical protein